MPQWRMNPPRARFWKSKNSLCHYWYVQRSSLGSAVQAVLCQLPMELTHCQGQTRRNSKSFQGIAACPGIPKGPLRYGNLQGPLNCRRCMKGACPQVLYPVWNLPGMRPSEYSLWIESLVGSYHGQIHNQRSWHCCCWVFGPPKSADVTGMCFFP